ncbi:MarR family winged helix-turn-helix transcriptional regulator [Paraburkholderia megapolitana]|uniref:MarR family winged helix-turn-helix transcriptional regulator n=1 Tax=Paraburkholderia megapolitana TaxID=420953 RepID=UPI0038B72D02
MRQSKPHLNQITAFRNSIVALARHLRQSVRADSENWTALMALGVIQRAKGAATPTQIATELGIQSSNVAQVLNELDRRGLVQRTQDHADKRKVRLSLTQEGTDLVYESRARRDQWLSDAIEACLSVQEKEQLLAAGELIQRVAVWSETGSQDSK